MHKALTVQGRQRSFQNSVIPEALEENQCLEAPIMEGHSYCWRVSLLEKVLQSEDLAVLRHLAKLAVDKSFTYKILADVAFSDL